MPETTVATAQVGVSPTFHITGPAQMFASALYTDAKGRRIQLPVRVSGETITLQVQAPQAPA